MNIRKLVIPALIALSVSACTDGIWLGEDDEEALPGHRIPVLSSKPQLTADAGSESIDLQLPLAINNKAWPQSGGTATSAVGQLASPQLSGKITVDTIKAGGGHDFSSHLIPTPVIANDILYSIDGAGTVTARTVTENNALVWTYATPKSERNTEIIGGGLAYNQGTLFATLGTGAVIALDANNGTLLWERSVNSPLRAAPRAAGPLLYITTLRNQAFALDASSGRIVWEHQGGYEKAAILGSAVPATNGKIVIIPYSSGEVYGLDAGSGRELWREMLIRPSHTSSAFTIPDIKGNPVIVGDMVYITGHSGILAAINLQTGRRLWERDISSIHTPWAAGNALFMISNNTLLCIHSADGRIKWATPILNDDDEKSESSNWSGPVLVGGQIYIVNSEGELLSYDADSGALLNRTDIPSGRYGGIVPAQAQLYIPRQDGKLVILDNKE